MGGGLGESLGCKGVCLDRVNRGAMSKEQRRHWSINARLVYHAQRSDAASSRTLRRKSVTITFDSDPENPAINKTRVCCGGQVLCHVVFSCRGRQRFYF